MAFGDWGKPKKQCSSREPDSNTIRCDLDKGHREAHRAELRGHLYVWGEDVRDAIPARHRVNSSMPEQTEKHAAAEIFTDGIKAARIWDQIVKGHAPYCVKCMCDLTRYDERSLKDATLEEKLNALRLAMELSAKHHTGRRAGHGYLPVKYGNDFGSDSPSNIEAPMCHACHTGAESELHPGPQLRKTEAG